MKDLTRFDKADILSDKYPFTW